MKVSLVVACETAVLVTLRTSFPLAEHMPLNIKFKLALL